MAGLLTGAMAGLGQGLAQSGEFLMRVTADEEKEKRLRQYEESVRKRQWEREDAAGAAAAAREERHRLEDRQWSVEDRDHGADLTRWQVGAQQAGQDRRTAATVGASYYRTNAGMTQRGQDAEGNTVWFNPATGQRVQAPEGWSPAQEGPDARSDDWSRQRYEIQWLQDELEEMEGTLRIDGASMPAAQRNALRDDIDRRRAELERLRGHSIGRTSAGAPRPQAGQDEPGPLTLDQFLGR
ncbi:hypothetical protein [uncultured Halomonas sp.]|uniref:hypothetical protein n=1 Tax=uncultured Halomonas sp. TaxID=173971 RepID=UPI0026172589|nr:hypothetical protein [uncultured Halomonas sp.]